MLALASLLNDDGLLSAANPDSRVVHHPAKAKSVIWPLVTILTALATATTLFFAASMALQSTIRVTVLFIHRGFQMRMEEVVRVIYLGTSIGGAVRDDHFLFIFILHQITGFFVVAFVCLIFQSMPPTLRSRIERWWRACLDPLEQWWRTTIVPLARERHSNRYQAALDKLKQFELMSFCRLLDIPEFKYVDDELIPEDMQCPVTLEPLVDPILHTSCGNMFSKMSVYYLTDPRCPLCRGPMDASTLAPVPNLIRNKLDALEVRCLTCNAKMKRERFRKHSISECLLVCPLECGASFAYDMTSQHALRCPQSLCSIGVKQKNL